jgi:hypothetical protein
MQFQALQTKEEKIQNSLIRQQQTMQSLQTLPTANPTSLHSKKYLCVKCSRTNWRQQMDDKQNA